MTFVFNEFLNEGEFIMRNLVFVIIIVVLCGCFGGCATSRNSDGGIPVTYGMSTSNGLIPVTFSTYPAGGRIVSLVNGNVLGSSSAKFIYKVKKENGPNFVRKGVVVYWNDGRSARIEDVFLSSEWNFFSLPIVGKAAYVVSAPKIEYRAPVHVIGKTTQNRSCYVEQRAYDNALSSLEIARNDVGNASDAKSGLNLLIGLTSFRTFKQVKAARNLNAMVGAGRIVTGSSLRDAESAVRRAGADLNRCLGY